jgi:hypothetical protein
MNLGLVEKIASAVLYEGYLLYPYRPSSIKNRQRFNFGVVYPQSYGLAHNEPWSMQTECLVRGDERTRIDARVRFLHLLAREEAGGRPSWQEAVEREMIASEIVLRCCEEAGERVPYEFPREVKSENGIVRRQENVNGLIEIAVEQVAERLSRLTVRILNLTPWEPASPGGTEDDDGEARSEARAETMLRALVSTHTILSTRGGEFVSLLDPPDELREAAAVCRNIGTYPVLIGEEGDCLLSSPIILYDYPQIAPESAGDLFDGTEIDEILTLRILTLTDDEKREMRESDERARQILERSEALPAEQLLKMHGALRGLRRAGGE